MLQVFVNGPPGCGKTSVCKLICEEFDLQMIATGDLLRENILLHSETGLVAKACIAKKELVPDEIVVQMVCEKIQECQENQLSWVLDGFPRTKNQSELLHQRKIAPNAMIVLDLPDQDILKRINGRRFDPVTGNIYHSPCILPMESNVRARLTRRSDDVPEKVASRIAAYKMHGKAVTNYYKRIEHKVPANRVLQQVMEDIRDLLQSLQSSSPSKNQASKKSHQSRLITHSIDRVDEDQEGQEDDHVRSNKKLTQDQDEDDEEDPQEENKSTQSTKKSSSSPVRKPRPQKQQQQTKKDATSVQRGGSQQNQNQQTSLASSVIFRSGSGTEQEQDECDNLDALVQQNKHPQVGPSRKQHAQQDEHYDQQEQEEETTNQTDHESCDDLHLRSGKYLDEPESSHSNGQVDDDQEHGDGQEQDLAPVEAVATEAVTAVAVAAVTASAATAPAGTSKSSHNKRHDDFDLAKFKQWLVEGIDLTKHGRRGSPHLRTVFCDVEFKRVFWQKPNSKRELKPKVDQSLALSEVLQVLRGMKTEVLKRSGQVTKYEKYFSLISDDRTLDLETNSEDLCEFLAKGFELIVPEN